MIKTNSLKKIEKKGIIAVIRAENQEEALKITEAVKEGGIEAIEITMTVPGAVSLIKNLTNEYSKDDILIGAGSVFRCRDCSYLYISWCRIYCFSFIR